jgi:hypothetical protein
LRYAIRSKAFIAILCGVGSASAQIALDPGLLEMASRLKVGESAYRGGGKFTLQQYNAGARDSTGWYRAESVRGGFSIKLPAPISDATFYGNGPYDSPIEQNILFGETSTTRYMATCFKTHIFSKDDVERVIKQLDEISRHFWWEHFSKDKREGSEFSGIDPKGVYFAGQTFFTESQMCQVTVGSYDAFDGITPEIRVVFDSFQSSKAK